MRELFVPILLGLCTISTSWITIITMLHSRHLNCIWINGLLHCADCCHLWWLKNVENWRFKKEKRSAMRASLFRCIYILYTSSFLLVTDTQPRRVCVWDFCFLGCVHPQIIDAFKFKVHITDTRNWCVTARHCSKKRRKKGQEAEGENKDATLDHNDFCC